MTGTGEAAVRAALDAQRGWCETLGSPFTARLCGLLGKRLDRRTPIARRMLDWPGQPDALHDSVPLRIAGGLHALVRRGRLPGLAALYPPAPLPDPDALWAAVSAALAEAGDELDRWLDGPPQTNEVARSAVLIAGLCTVAAETALPLAVYELGASAGLNLLFDRYDCRLGQRRLGEPSSRVLLAPSWTGGELPDAPIRIASRRGVDTAPLDAADPGDRERLLAYVWADQADRLARLEGALAIAAADPPSIDRADAADWIEAEFGPSPAAGACRVVMHSIAFQYFPPETQRRVRACIESAGRAADASAAVAWLRYETDPAFAGRASLRLTTWPDGTDRLLALADAHGRAVEWR